MKTAYMSPKVAIPLILACQKAGGIAAVVNFHSEVMIGDLRYAGVNLADLLISQPDNQAQAIEIRDALIKSGAVDLVVML